MKQNTETILKRFRIVLELFQAYWHIYLHVKKYANPKTVGAPRVKGLQMVVKRPAEVKALIDVQLTEVHRCK